MNDPSEHGVLLGERLVGYSDLTDRAARAASGLESLGVTRGDTVALLLRNDIAFFEASMAANRLGAAPVPINWHGSPDEIRYVLLDSRAKVLVAHADLLASLADSLPPEIPIRVVPTPPEIRRAYPAGAAHGDVEEWDVPWDEWIDGYPPSQGDAGGPVASMIYTSGTTGRPKGVRRLDWPESSVPDLAAMVAGLRAVGLEPGVRTVITGPLYHTAPNTYALTALALGGLVVLQPRFHSEELLALIERHRVTHLHMVPTMFVRLLKEDLAVRERHDLSSLQSVVHAAAPCPPQVKRAMIEWWGPIISEYYGATETGPVVACSTDEWLAHPGTVGRPLDGAVVRVYDDFGDLAPSGVAGEIYMRSGAFPDFTYEGRPEARREVERDGLITCGDVGYFDQDGYLYLCDRKRDMVISGGVNIYPAEIEACLLQMPGVSDCAVFGVPDDEFGEAVAAAVEPHSAAALRAEDVQAWVRQHLAGFKVPKVVELHEHLPREDSGKIFKRLLRDRYWASTGRTI